MAARVWKDEMLDASGNALSPSITHLRAKDNWTATAAPTVSNDDTQGYAPKSVWIWQAEGRVWICASNATGAAVWVEMGAGGGSSAPTDADYLVKTAHADLSAERVVTDHDVVWDWATAGQAKGRVAKAEKEFAFKGVINASLGAGTSQDWNPTGLADAVMVRTDPGDFTRGIGGIQGGASGRILIIKNVSSTGVGQVQLHDDDTGSAAANRIDLGDITSPLTLDDRQAAVLVYDGTDSRWTVIAHTSTSTTPTLAHGTYTPTITMVSNVTATTAYACQYLRVGDTVTVSGKVDITADILGGATAVGISLPIASAFTASEQCGGSGCHPASAPGDYPTAIYADDTNDRAEMSWQSPGDGAQTIHFQFTYRVL